MLSITEAVHFSKPVIGIPIIFDQHLNMRNAEHRGFGINLSYDDLTTEQLQNAMRIIFTDPRFENSLFNFILRDLFLNFQFLVSWKEQSWRHLAM